MYKFIDTTESQDNTELPSEHSALMEYTSKMKLRAIEP